MSNQLPPAATPRRHRVWWRGVLVGFLYVIVLGSIFGPLSGKLTGQEKNTTASFLSKSAESTRALNASGAFISQTNTPTIILYERDAPITPADQASAVADLTKIRNTTWLDGTPSPPIVSKDGKAMQVFLPMDGKNQDLFIQNIKDLRTLLKDSARPAGLTTYVTGLGGTSADLFDVFSSLNGTLLIATGAIVILILLVIYRSPILWLLPVIGAGLSFTIATGILYLLAKNGVLTVNGQSAGILPVLTFGAATDYALLLTSRYREELHRHESTWDAMKVAWRGAAPAILASAATVILSLMCLLFSELEGNKGLGPVAAIGIACAAVTMLFMLPAFLLAGRWLFWPRIPRLDGQDPVHEGMWKDLAERVAARSTAFGAGTLVVLFALALATTGLKSQGIPQSQALSSRPESVVGQEHLATHFAAGIGAPLDIVAPAADREAVIKAVSADKDVDSVVAYTGSQAGPGSNAAPLVKNGQVLLSATLKIDTNTSAATQVVKRLRTEVDAVGKDVLIGGFTAIELDIRNASKRDNKVIIPIVLLLIVLVLAILLRALVAPLILIATVVLSYAATLGMCALVFNHVFDFPGSDASFPLFTFVFLVALGVDYNIFLMSRVREETPVHGTYQAMHRGLTVTGGVITSAGLVLAATFAVLATLPLVFLSEIGFAVAFGVLLDTFIVRSLLVPAIVFKLGDKIWWPSKLAQPKRPVLRKEAVDA